MLYMDGFNQPLFSFVCGSIHDVVHSVRNRGKEAKNKPLTEISNGYRNRYNTA